MSQDVLYDERLPPNFWSKVKANATSGCWEWTANTNRGGYGHFINDRCQEVAGSVLAHRISWSFLRGPIPSGLQIDHLCRNTGCVNPAHLEPVTAWENARRGVGPNRPEAPHCVNGHEFTLENTSVTERGRVCRACKFAWNDDHKEQTAERTKRWVLANQEKKKADDKAYRQEHSARRNELERARHHRTKHLVTQEMVDKKNAQRRARYQRKLATSQD